MSTVDTWLLDLGNRGNTYAVLAATVARAQHHAAWRMGHLLGISDPFVRRKLTEAGRWGSLPDLNVRCIRCDAVASLKDWVAATKLDDDQRRHWWETIVKRKGRFSAAFLHDCPGDAYSEAVLGVLEANAHGRGTGT